MARIEVEITSFARAGDGWVGNGAIVDNSTQQPGNVWVSVRLGSNENTVRDAVLSGARRRIEVREEDVLEATIQ